MNDVNPLLATLFAFAVAAVVAFVALLGIAVAWKRLFDEDQANSNDG